MDICPGLPCKPSVTASAGNYAAADSLVRLLESGVQNARDRVFARLHRFALAILGRVDRDLAVARVARLNGNPQASVDRLASMRRSRNPPL